MGPPRGETLTIPVPSSLLRQLLNRLIAAFLPPRPPFPTHEELFAATRGLRDRLVELGRPAAAEELARGFSRLNGLTDGWALFLDSLRRVEKGHGPALPPAERAALVRIRRAAHRAVWR